MVGAHGHALARLQPHEGMTVRPDSKKPTSPTSRHTYFRKDA